MNLPVPILPNPLAQPPQGGPGPWPDSPGMSDERRAELREAWASILKRKWIILGLAVLVGAVAWLLAQTLPPVYRANVSLMIEATKVVKIDEASNVLGSEVATQIQVIQSRGVAERTARALKLWEHPAFDPRLPRPSWWERMAQAVGMGAAPPPARTWTEDQLVAATSWRIGSGLKVTPIRGTQVVTLSYDAEDSALAARVANEVARQYIESVRDQRSMATQQASQQLMDRITPLREQLAKSEQALQAFRERQGMVALGGAAQSAAGQQIGGMNDRLLAARTARLGMEAVYQQIKAVPPGGDYTAIPIIARDAMVADLRRQIVTASAKLAEMQQTLSAEHFRVKQAEREIAELNALVASQSAAAAQTFMREYETARSTEQVLERSVGEIRGSLQGVNREEFELTVLERDVQRNRAILDLFLNRAKETDVIGKLEPEVARVLDTALPGYQVAPNRTQIVRNAVIAVLLLAALGAVALDRLDNTVKGISDAEARLGQHVLAALPLRPKDERSKLARTFVDQPQSLFAEGIRTARTGVMLSGLDMPRKVILVTSSVPGEGKTTVAINLALAHAQITTTLLVDCDLRRSRVGRSLGTDTAQKGLTNLVAGQASLEECVTLVKDTGLFVMPVGDPPPNPLEMIMSQRFHDVLERLGQRFETIIIDSPPVELVSDAMVLAPRVTSVVYVVQAMQTPVPLVRKNIARLQRAGGRLVGVIVNQLDFKTAQRYQGEYGADPGMYDGYGYGYGEGYGYDAARKRQGKDQTTYGSGYVINDRPAEAKATGASASRSDAGPIT